MVTEARIGSHDHRNQETVLTGMDNSHERKEIEKILDSYESKKGALMSILIDIQSKSEYLSKDDLLILSKRLDVPLNEIFSIITNCNEFKLEPPVEHVIKVCLCPSCYLKGAEDVLREVARLLAARADIDLPTDRYSLETVKQCATPSAGPCVILDDKYHLNMSRRKVRLLLNKNEVKP